MSAPRCDERCAHSSLRDEEGNKSMARRLLVYLTGLLTLIIANDLGIGHLAFRGYWSATPAIIYTTIAGCWSMAAIWAAGPRMAKWLSQTGVAQANAAPATIAAVSKEIEARLASRSKVDGTEPT